MKRKVLGWLLLLLPVLCIGLELLPAGTAAAFGRPLPDGSVELVKEYYSYFRYALDGLCFASGEFGSAFVPVFTVLALIFALRYFFTGRGRAGVVATAALGLAAAVSPLFVAAYHGWGVFELVTPLSLVLAALLAAEAVIALLIEPLQRKKPKK